MCLLFDLTACARVAQTAAGWGDGEIASSTGHKREAARKGVHTLS